MTTEPDLPLYHPSSYHLSAAIQLNLGLKRQETESRSCQRCEVHEDTRSYNTEFYKSLRGSRLNVYLSK